MKAYPTACPGECGECKDYEKCFMMVTTDVEDCQGDCPACCHEAECEAFHQIFGNGEV